MKRILALTLAFVLLLSSAQAAVSASSTAGDPPAGINIVRLGGSDRIETANLICAEGWKDKAPADDDASSSDAPSGMKASGSAAALTGVSASDAEGELTEVFSAELSATDAVVLSATGEPSPSDAPGGHTPIFAVIANGYNFADALAGVPLAYALDAPILLTDGKTIRDSVLRQLDRIGAEYIYILGGENAVSAAAEKQLRDLGCTTARLAGDTRFGTSVMIADEMKKISGKSPETVFIAYAYNYPDALSAGAAAALLGSPILYSDKNGAPDNGTAAFIMSCAPNVVILGGTSAISDNAENAFGKMTTGGICRISGSDRYATASNIHVAYADLFTSKNIAVASGADFPDSLAGGVLAAKLGMPVFPISTVKTTEGIYDLVKKNSPDKVYVFGGTGAISDYVINTLLSGGTVTTQPAATGEKHIIRTLTVKSSSAKVYTGLEKNAKLVATVYKNKKFTSLGEDEGPDGISWFKISVDGKIGWICRKDLTISNTYIPIEDKVFNETNKPVIYLSPSKQGHNEYATGKTTEQKEMEAVAKVMKTILDKEYDCTTYIATPAVDIIERTDEALGYGADIYLAIHSNATGTRDVRYGASTYYFPACSQSKLFSQNIVKELNRIAPMKPNFTPQVINGMQSFYNIGYGEVRSPSNSGMVAVLAETEFHDNKIGSEWIRSHHEEIARAYIEALAETFGIQKK